MTQRARNWGFLVVEMVLIVLSILLAFALDSWWDKRQQRDEELEILQGLRKEFVQIRDTLDFRLSEYAESMRELEQLDAATRSGRWESTETDIDRALSALIAPPTTDLGTGVLDALIGSGRMELLRNRSLRARLAGWEGVFGEVKDDEVFSRDYVFDTIIPYLIRNGVPMSGAFSNWVAEPPVPPRFLGADTAAVSRLLSDPEFRSLLEIRVGFKLHIAGEYRAALEAAEAILAEIDRSGGQRDAPAAR